jgi:hypothetical protein
MLPLLNQKAVYSLKNSASESHILITVSSTGILQLMLVGRPECFTVCMSQTRECKN